MDTTTQHAPTRAQGAGDTDRTVSVIVPVYNTERYLDQALESLERQTYRDLEIVVVNDGSTDGSAAIMREHAARDPRVRIVDKENGGYGAAMNRGIAEATGGWIAILEPDDWVEPGMYADMLALAARYKGSDPAVDIIETPYWVIADADTPHERKLHCSYRGRVRPRTQPFTIKDAPHLLSHHPSIWTALYRRGFLDRCGIRFREFPGAGWADNPFLVETLCQARAILYLPRPYYCYREETPEKSARLARRSPLLPFERWNDMVDVLERLHVTDRGVWQAQVARGFTYMGGVVEHTGIASRPDIQRAVDKMFSRMDPGLVFSNPRVPVAAKRLFAERRGIANPPISRLMQVRDLVGQSVYALWNKGPVELCRMAGRYVSTYAKRAGR